MSNTQFPSLAENRGTRDLATDLLINYAVLEEAQEYLGASYRDGEPFPHIVVDDFLPSSTILRLIDEYPDDQELPIWNDASFKDGATGEYVQKSKRNIRDLLRMPPTYRQLIWELNSQPFLSFLSRVTGIANLIPDPNLRGAGIHQIGRGGLLKVHADFASHREFALDRRLNLLLYLNPEWPEAYGGHLELWDREMQGPPKRVLPTLNRCVIFNTTATSYHGHPQPLTCPEGVYRKSLALYYYTNGRPEGEAHHGFATLWQDVPERYR